MRLQPLIAAVALAVIACGGNNSTGPTGGNPTGGNNGGNNGGNTGGGPVGAVIVGNNFFQSSHNGTTNPAVDTIPANTAVTWTWTNTGATAHGIQSVGSPSFTSGPTQSGNGQTTVITFTTPGTYQYDCTVHGSLMTGRIVVQ